MHTAKMSPLLLDEDLMFTDCSTLFIKIFVLLLWKTILYIF